MAAPGGGPDCAPGAAGRMPGWLTGRWATPAAVGIWLPLLVAEPAAHASERGSPAAAWVALVLAAACFAGAMVLAARPLPSPRDLLAARMLFGVEVVATVALAAGWESGVPLFALLGIAAAVVSDRYGLVVVAVVTVLGAVTVAASGLPSGSMVGVLISTFLSGAGTWSLRRLFQVIAELRRTREELARTAVSQERLRFSRDLHDLLGHTLSVIVVKAEAVRRLAPVDAEAAAVHAGDIETIGRDALAEVRHAVAGYRGAGLAGELERARLALDAAGVRAGVEVPQGTPDELPDEVQRLFGWVVREGVTNVIRHADAARCDIVLSRDDGLVRLELRDDGRGRPVAAAGVDDRYGGLDGLRERALAARGRLEAGATPTGWRVTVEVPVGAGGQGRQ